jgi:DNA invertase Pin-like site-specific DNA recombinase
MGHIVGYARVSTDDQSTDIQRGQLEAAGCNRIFEEQRSGTTRDGRTKLQALLEHLREGDTVVVTRIDRLARSMRDLQNIVHEIREIGANLKATEQPIDTGSAAGKAFLDMLGVFAEFETNLRRERQLEGIAKAKAAGKYKGRVRKISAARVLKLQQEGKKIMEIAAELGCKRQSVHRALRREKAASGSPAEV